MNAVKQNNYTASDVVHAKKVCVSADRNQAVPKNKSDSSQLSGPDPKQINILSLKIKSISKPKCDYIAKLSSKHKVDLTTLQETHTNDISPPSK